MRGGRPALRAAGVADECCGDDCCAPLAGIENHADRARRGGEPGAEVSWLRAELATDDELAA